MNQNQFKMENEMKMPNILIGIFAGAVVGAVIGVIFAPQIGAVTRKKIIDAADDFSRDMQETIANNIKTFSSRFGNANVDASGLVDNGKSKSENGYKKFQNIDYSADFLPKA